MIPEDEGYLLEFVIGHEMAHVELQHALACLRDPDIKPLTASIPWKLYFLIIPIGYPDKLEQAADEWIYHRMKRLHRSDYECLKFLRMLDRYAKNHGFDSRRGKPQELLEEMRHAPEGARAVSPIDNHLRAHPPAYERLRHLNELSAAAGK
jgi:Zn-dependent protease with chaperone function